MSGQPSPAVQSPGRKREWNLGLALPGAGASHTHMVRRCQHGTTLNTPTTTTQAHSLLWQEERESNEASLSSGPQV